MQLNVEAMFNQGARMSIKVSATDMQTLADREKFEAGVTYWQDFQDGVIAKRVQKIKDLGIATKKPRGRPPNKKNPVVALVTA